MRFAVVYPRIRNKIFTKLPKMKIKKLFRRSEEFWELGHVMKNTDISLRVLWRPLVPVCVKEVALCMQTGLITKPRAVFRTVIWNLKFDLFVETHIDRHPSLMTHIPFWIKAMTVIPTAISECVVKGIRHAKFFQALCNYILCKRRSNSEISQPSALSVNV